MRLIYGHQLEQVRVQARRIPGSKIWAGKLIIRKKPTYDIDDHITGVEKLAKIIQIHTTRGGIYTMAPNDMIEIEIWK